MNNAMSNDINICGLCDTWVFPLHSVFEHRLDSVREFLSWQFLRDSLTIAVILSSAMPFFGVQLASAAHNGVGGVLMDGLRFHTNGFSDCWNQR